MPTSRSQKLPSPTPDVVCEVISADPTVITSAANGLASITPTTAESQRRIAGRVAFQPALITGKGAIAASSTRHRVRAASMQHRRNTPTNNTR